MHADTITAFIWAGLVLVTAGFEVYTAVFKKRRTLSWEVWRWVTGVWKDSPIPKPLAIFNRVFIALFFTWLIVHFDFGWLSP
jgi:hypothetical protein